MFLELDASAAKTGRPVTPVNPKTPAEGSRRARDVSFTFFNILCEKIQFLTADVLILRIKEYIGAS